MMFITKSAIALITRVEKGAIGTYHPNSGRGTLITRVAHDQFLQLKRSRMQLIEAEKFNACF